MSQRVPKKNNRSQSAEPQTRKFLGASPSDDTTDCGRRASNPCLLSVSPPVNNGNLPTAEIDENNNSHPTVGEFIDGAFLDVEEILEREAEGSRPLSPLPIPDPRAAEEDPPVQLGESAEELEDLGQSDLASHLGEFRGDEFLSSEDEENISEGSGCP